MQRRETVPPMGAGQIPMPAQKRAKAESADHDAWARELRERQAGERSNASED